MSAKLRLIYDKKYLDPSFMLRVTVEPVNTSPDVLKKCLVVVKGDATTSEYLERVAEYDDVVTSPLPEQPLLVDRFSSEGYGPFLINDTIHIVSYPQIWTSYFGYTGDITVIAWNVDDPDNPIVNPLPAFGNNISFRVGSDPNVYADGVANRYYNGLPGSQFLTDDTVFEYPNFDTANNTIISAEADAQSLVDAMNADNYSGIDTEDYV